MSNKYRALVTDDDELSLKLLASDLEDNGFEVVQAQDGAIALDILKNDARFDIILLDRMMPNMGGIEALIKIKEDERTAHIPVIMQTAAGSSEQIREGIGAGAFYYLTKPFAPNVMLAIVKSAIRSNLQKKFIVQATDIFKTFPMVEASKFSFRTLEDTKSLAFLISQYCPDPDKIISGISELMMNAVEHGNLEITYAEKTSLLLEEKLIEEIDARLASKAFKDRHAHIYFERHHGSIEITIEDEGKGFDWEPYLDFAAKRATDPNGRGIAIAKSLSFDSVEYIGKGNKVICKTSV